MMGGMRGPPGMMGGTLMRNVMPMMNMMQMIGGSPKTAEAENGETKVAAKAA